MAGVNKSPTKKSFFKAIFKKSLEAMVILDRQDRIVEINPAGCILFGSTKKKLLGKLVSKFLVSPINWQEVQRRKEIEIKQPQNKFKIVECSQVEDLLPKYKLLVLKDITELKSQTVTELDLHHQRVELFAEVTLKIRQSLQLPEILQTAVTEVQRILQADRVLIYQVFDNGTGMPIKEAVLPDFQPILGVEFPEEVFPPDYRELYTKGRVKAIADVHGVNTGLAECLIEFMDQWQIKSKLVVPILQNVTVENKVSDRLWGLLIAHQCCKTRQWTNFEQELMRQLADQIGIALFQGK